MKAPSQIEPWPEPVDLAELLDEIKTVFADQREEVQTLTPLWLAASFLDEDISSLKAQRYTLKKILRLVPSVDRENFLLILLSIAHPRSHPLINQQLAKLKIANQ